MSIKINKPYKIIPERYKRYESHYGIPAGKVLVVPMKELGEEVSCDIRWEDDNGELHKLENKIFVSQNLVPLNPLLEVKLHELWQHYYETKK